MSYQDVVTVKEDFYKIIKDPKNAQFLYDENLSMMIIALRKGPLTIEEIMEYYKENENEKALKTIYRYIKQLQEAGLVIEAGKRIYTDEINRNKSATIYSRTAKVFFDKTRKDETTYDIKDPYYDVIAKTLELYIPEKKEIDPMKICELMEKMYLKSLEYFEKGYKEFSEDYNNLMKGQDIIGIERFYRIITIFIFALENDFKQEILNCIKE